MTIREGARGLLPPPSSRASYSIYALKTCFALSKDIGCCGVTHPLDEEVRAFYRRFGFVDLPGDPHRAMIVRMKDLERSGFGA